MRVELLHDSQETMKMTVRNVNVHRFVRFTTRLLIDKTGAYTLDLHSGLGFLLDVLDEHALQYTT